MSVPNSKVEIMLDAMIGYLHELLCNDGGRARAIQLNQFYLERMNEYDKRQSEQPDPNIGRGSGRERDESSNAIRGEQRSGTGKNAARSGDFGI